MALPPGTRLGPYEVVAFIGEGAMGQVYRARDAKLDRDVALKVLPESFAADPDRLMRFEREAKILASLDHPHIAQIHDLEESGSVRALVMELVEGPTLADRIAQGAIPLDEALAIARQIAMALDAAHEHGVIHRDLKPENVKTRADGTVKVLDFGLAKATESPDALTANESQSPTTTTPLRTRAGVILGTAAYMSPEQARGQPVDRRTDIWSFGAVLYEMLTGARLFDGATVSDTMAKVLTQEADWTTLPAHTPAPIRRLLRRCLEKDRTRRLESAADARLEIEEAIATPAAEILPGGVAAPHASPRALVISLATAVLVAAGLAVPAVRYLRQVPASAPSETRLDIATPTTNDPVSFALSPNGQAIAFVASGDGPARLYLRSFDATTAQPLVGTDGAAYPFWSPDSRSVAFMAGDELKRLDLGGGAPRTLATAAAGRGGSWSTEGVVLFAPTAVGPLARVPAAGGPVTPATTLGEGQFGHRFPVFLPDGRHFLFHARGAADVNGIYLGSLDTAETTRLTAADTAGTYLPSGWLLWVRAGALTAQRLDVARGTLTGDPMTLADDVLIDSGTYLAAVSASASGLVAYRSGGASRRQLVWFGRSGTPLGTLGAPDDQALRYVRVSPDGRRVAVARTVQGKIDLWLLDDSRLSRFTFDSGSEYFPVWSPDGSRIVFASDRSGPLNLHVRPASGAGAEDVLVQSPQTKVPSDWSADGQYLLYSTLDPRTGWDIWVRPMAAVLRPTQHDPSESGPEHAPWAFANGPVAEAEGRFSPDGRWVAYESNASGRVEIYVRPFAPPPSPGASASPAGGQWQVSTDGGVYPVWRADGRELYYLGPDAAMMAVPISVRESTLEPETPVTLFRTRIFAGGADGGQGWQYDVTRDGRFLINTVLDDAVTAPITLIQNWTPPGS